MATTSARQSGFTLIEAIITMLVVAVLATIGAKVMSTAFENYFAGREIVQDSAQGTLALERMTRELRTVRTPADLTTMGANTITFVDADGDTIAYALSGASLTRSQNGGAAQPLAGDVSALSFTYLKNDGKTTAATSAEVWYITAAVTVQLQSVGVTFRGTVKPENF